MIFQIEPIWHKYGNRYKAITVASLEARKLKDEQSKGLFDQNINHILVALKKLTTGKIRYKE